LRVEGTGRQREKYTRGKDRGRGPTCFSGSTIEGLVSWKSEVTGKKGQRTIVKRRRELLPKGGKGGLGALGPSKKLLSQIDSAQGQSRVSKRVRQNIPIGDCFRIWDVIPTLGEEKPGRNIKRCTVSRDKVNKGGRHNPSH